MNIIFTLPIYVGIILKIENTVFMVQRNNTDWMQGYWNFPGGLVEKHETTQQAAIRELYEETGVRVKPENLSLVHVLHVHKNEQNTKDIIGIYFLAEHWSGEPRNNEPKRQIQAQWFNLESLPENITEHATLALQGVLQNEHYSEHGWQTKE